MTAPPPRRRVLTALALVVVAAAVYFAILRNPFGGREQYVRHAAPAFNVLYKAKAVRRVTPRPGELLRLSTRRGPLRATTTVRRLRLPPYRGDVAGLLPVYADAHARELAGRFDGFRLIEDTRARVHTAPGYEVGFSFHAGARVGEGTDLFVLEPEQPSPRDGVVLSYRLTKPDGRQPRRLRKAAQAMRSALRSFEFGPDRF